jgi:hypothetical protein
MTTSRITELSTKLASSIAGKGKKDVKRLCRSIIELAVKEAEEPLNRKLAASERIIDAMNEAAIDDLT